MSSKNYYPKGTNDTPFNPQLQHFDFICGQIINENRILKFVVVAAVLSFFLSIGICIYAVAQPLWYYTPSFSVTMGGDCVLDI